DRAFAMTADSDCELRDKIGGGLLVLHTCRGISGYSGAPILVRGSGNEMRIAGIQIATFNAGGVQKMVAVPAQSIVRESGLGEPPMWTMAKALSELPVAAACKAPPTIAYGLLEHAPDVMPTAAVATPIVSPMVTWHDDILGHDDLRNIRLAW